jgi:hypothetical protein
LHSRTKSRSAGLPATCAGTSPTTASPTHAEDVVVAPRRGDQAAERRGAEAEALDRTGPTTGDDFSVGGRSTTT